MTASPFDPRARLHYADTLLAEAAGRLHLLLREAAQQLRPFPPYPGAFFTFGVEVDLDGVLARDLGCIVVTEAGDLKELQIGFDMEAMGGLGANNPAATRDETLADVNLSPRDRLILLHNGLRAISRLLEERQRPAAPGDAARADV